MSNYPVLKGLLQSSHHYTWNTADAVGRGATAVVYLGRQKESGQVVAVKVFHEHLRYSHCREDLPELEILRRLKHDNIITVQAIEQEAQSKRPVLVMEYCEGGSVLSMLEQAQYRYGLTEPHFFLLLQHVASGIKYLRQSGVVHRDIKPANIMRSLTEDGSSVYKLTDFGAARQLHDDENFTSMYGTEEYLHPDMYEKGVLRLPTGQRFNSTMDLWSLGVTFYHVATGQLPFQAYGGRSNKETMYRIISEKERGVISGQQHFEGGPIHWARELPSTCLLSSGVRHIITPVLAGLMEADRTRVLSYEALFSFVQRFKSMIRLNVFHYAQAAVHTVFLDPSATLSGLQDSITSITDQPASKQVLLVGGHALEDIVDPLTPISSYPTHIKHSTIFLFPQEPVLTQPPPPPAPEIPPFPEFLQVIDVNRDTNLAHNCLTRGHHIKHHTDIMAQQQALLVEGHLCLRTYVESRLRTVDEALQLIQQLVVESKKRFALFYSNTRSIQALLASLSHDTDPYFRDVLNDDTLLQVQRKTEERVQEIALYRQGLQDKLAEARPHAAQWPPHCLQSQCTSKVEHQLTVMSQIQAKFRRDKSVKNMLTSHDENIHRFERQKLQETCMRVLSILTGHCVPARDHLHKHAVLSTGLLVKVMARIIKVEKNNESVTNCQQLLSARLDKLEAKCQDEMAHLQRRYAKLTKDRLLRNGLHEPQTKISKQRNSSVDEGLGTSVLGSSSALSTSVLGSAASAASFTPTPNPTGLQDKDFSKESAGEESLNSGSIHNSLQSLRVESEEVLGLVMDNLYIMKRLGLESIQEDSRESLSRLMQDPGPS